MCSPAGGRWASMGSTPWWAMAEAGGAVTARAGANIPPLQDWGKRGPGAHLPPTGSLSVTLAGLGSLTTVRFGGDQDEVLLDGAPAPAAFADRVSAFLDLVRARAGLRLAAEVATRNSVPTAAGLASSASGFAAL